MTHKLPDRPYRGRSAVGLGGLLWYSLQQDTAYYKHVDEVMASPEEWKGSRCSSTASS